MTFGQGALWHDNFPIDPSLAASYGLPSRPGLVLTVAEADISTAKPDPFCIQSTNNVICDVLDTRGDPHGFASRETSKKAEKHFRDTRIGDTALFSAEVEFFAMQTEHIAPIAKQPPDYCMADGTRAAEINLCDNYLDLNSSAYSFTTPQFHQQDECHDMRSELLANLAKSGMQPQFHKHLGSAQHLLCTQRSSLTDMADLTQFYKYYIRRTAQSYGKTATFMPNPICGCRKSSMRIRQSIHTNGKTIFYNGSKASMSEFCLYYIGGILKHCKALQAFTNPSINSYKNPNSDQIAPDIYVSSANGIAEEVIVCFPDPLANPYLAFAALLMAGLAGIQDKVTPENRPEQSPHHWHTLGYKSATCDSLSESLEALQTDSAFLTLNNVFDKAFLANYIALKQKEIKLCEMTLNPAERFMYYNL